MWLLQGQRKKKRGVSTLLSMLCFHFGRSALVQIASPWDHEKGYRMCFCSVHLYRLLLVGCPDFLAIRSSAPYTCTDCFASGASAAGTSSTSAPYTCTDCFDQHHGRNTRHLLLLRTLVQIASVLTQDDHIRIGLLLRTLVQIASTSVGLGDTVHVLLLRTLVQIASLVALDHPNLVATSAPYTCTDCFQGQGMGLLAKGLLLRTLVQIASHPHDG